MITVLGVLALVQVAPATALPQPAGPGCQPDRSTVVHSSGVALVQQGMYQPCLVDTGMTTAESGLAIDRAGTLIRSASTNPFGVAVSSDDGDWHSYLTESFDAAAANPRFATADLDPVDDPSLTTGQMPTEAEAYIAMSAADEAWATFARQGGAALGNGASLAAARMEHEPRRG